MASTLVIVQKSCAPIPFWNAIEIASVELLFHYNRWNNELYDIFEFYLWFCGLVSCRPLFRPFFRLHKFIRIEIFCFALPRNRFLPWLALLRSHSVYYFCCPVPPKPSSTFAASYQIYLEVSWPNGTHIHRFVQILCFYHHALRRVKSGKLIPLDFDRLVRQNVFKAEPHKRLVPPMRLLCMKYRDEMGEFSNKFNITGHFAAETMSYLSKWDFHN